MSTLEVDAPIAVHTVGLSKDTILRYGLLVVAAVYVIVSLYLIFETRSRLTAAVIAQDAAIERLRERQAATEEDLKASNQALTQQLGITERDYKRPMRARRLRSGRTRERSRDACRTSRMQQPIKSRSRWPMCEPS